MNSTNKIQVLDSTFPLKAYPEQQVDEILNTKFKFWLANLLSIKADNEQKLDLALPIIKKIFWSLGFKEIKTAFEMYALGQLQTKPIPNYFDIILVGNIFNDYKQTQQTKPKKVDIDEEKKQQDILDIITLFDSYNQNGKIPEKMVWVYTYLEERLEDFEFAAKEKKILMQMGAEQKLTLSEQKIKAKRVLLGRYFSRLLAREKHIKDLI